jgi:hypothetical protein
MRKPAAKPAPKGTTAKHAGGSKHPAATSPSSPGGGGGGGGAGGGGGGGPAKTAPAKHKTAPAKHAPAKAHKSTAPASKPAPTAKTTKVIHGPAAKAPAKKKPTAKATKKRTLTPGAVGLCSAEAVAASLRLSGRAVGADDVLSLYWHTAHDPEAGASILATLKAASEYGVAGVRPDWFGAVPLETPGPVILGAELPGSHALLAEPRGWWSWGDLHDPACWPDAVTEEAWAVRWPAWL